jgi:tetratricopeptide (TPR) repeat protein
LIHSHRRVPRIVLSFLLCVLLGVPVALAQSADGEPPTDDLTKRVHALTGAGQFGEVVLTLEGALAEDPHRALLYQPLVKNYAYLGLFDHAERRTRDLYFENDHPTLNPEDLRGGGHCRLALIHTMQGERKETLAHVDSMLALADPDQIYPGAPTCASYFEASWGEHDRAAERYEQILGATSGIVRADFLPWAVHVHREAGNHERADEMMAEIVALRQALEAGLLDDAIAQASEEAGGGGTQQETHKWMAQVHVLQGNEEEAVASLRRAYEAGALMRYHWWKAINPVLRPLHDTPAFEELLADMEADIAPMRARTVERLTVERL